MKTFKSYLAEGKIIQSKIKAGDKVEVHAKGSLAKRSGFKKGDNPYEGKKNQLSPRQIKKKKRLVKYTKKNK